MNQFIDQAVKAVHQELQRQMALPDFNYAGEQVHPINAMAVLRDFTKIVLSEDQVPLFLQEWDKQGRR